LKSAITGKIIEHEKLPSGHMRIILDAPELAASANPGQFAHVLCFPSGAGYDPLLRRPLSIHWADATQGQVAFLYEIVGRGTAILAEKCPGQTLDVLGPLGQGFTLPTTPTQPVLLIGGGVGVAPLYFLAQRVINIVGYERTTFALGARTGPLMSWCTDVYADLGLGETLAAIASGSLQPDIRTATEDGTCGCQGYVTEVVYEYCRNIDKSNPPLVYACGPTPMLQRVVDITKSCGLWCQVSLESKMACGIGACMSCVVKVKSGNSFEYLRACKEGPVFDADEVIW